MIKIVDKSIKYKKQNYICKHAPCFPKNIRCIIAGTSGGGKTNLLINLLESEKLLDYCDIYVYSSTLHQPAYEYLKEYYGNMEKAINHKHKISHFFDGDEEIKNPDELDSTKSHIMIFDDVMNANQKVIKDYFCSGRHNNVNMFYLDVNHFIYQNME
jgi:ABC-type lipoprotein export system ATPase subunit